MFLGADAMNQIAIAPEVLERLHELAKTTHRSDAEVIDEALNSYLAADRHYLKVLTERIAAADRGEFASEEEAARFFAEHGE
jgi:RHH-type transcriptional regulator, rel operon repressor / antitoxin RelB